MIIKIKTNIKIADITINKMQSECQYCKEVQVDVFYDMMQHAIEDWQNMEDSTSGSKARYVKLGQILDTNELARYFKITMGLEENRFSDVLNHINQVGRTYVVTRIICTLVLGRIVLTDLHMMSLNRALDFIDLVYSRIPDYLAVVQRTILALVEIMHVPLDSITPDLLHKICELTYHKGVYLPSLEGGLHNKLHRMSITISMLTSNDVSRAETAGCENVQNEYRITRNKEKFKLMFEGDIPYNSTEEVIRKAAKEASCYFSHPNFDLEPVKKELLAMFVNKVKEARRNRIPKWYIYANDILQTQGDICPFEYEATVETSFATFNLMSMRCTGPDMLLSLTIDPNGFLYNSIHYTSICDITFGENEVRDKANLISYILTHWASCRYLVSPDNACYLPNDAIGEYTLGDGMTQNVLYLAGYTTLKDSTGHNVLIKYIRDSNTPISRLAEATENNEVLHVNKEFNVLLGIKPITDSTIIYGKIKYESVI